MGNKQNKLSNCPSFMLWDFPGSRAIQRSSSSAWQTSLAEENKLRIWRGQHSCISLVNLPEKKKMHREKAPDNQQTVPSSIQLSNDEWACMWENIQERGKKTTWRVGENSGCLHQQDRKISSFMCNKHIQN